VAQRYAALPDSDPLTAEIVLGQHGGMYLVMVLGLTLVAPLVSVIIELVMSGPTDAILVAGKWFTFWGLGVRLFTAGISQTVRPDFTARTILGEVSGGTATAPTLLVQELGFANIGIGLIGILSLPFPDWALPAALAGGLFLGLAGVRHIAKSTKNAKEWLATVSDLLVSAIALVFVIYSWGSQL
jgi:hypothetical protein